MVKKNYFDVIIVGGGIGGLTTGALLTKKKYKVLLLEQQKNVGGCCTSFQKKGFTFNSGIENISGLSDKGVISFFLKEIGIKKGDFFIKNTLEFVFKGKRIRLVGETPQVIELFSKLFPKEKENIARFFTEAKKAYENRPRYLAPYDIPLSVQMIREIYGFKEILNFRKKSPYFFDWMSITYKQKLGEYFKDKDLKLLFYALIGYIGREPSKVLASNALISCLSYYLYGGYFPKGGAQKFSDELKKIIKKNGGQVMVNQKVDEIIIRKNKVIGVVSEKKIFSSPVVISNVNAKTTFLKLIKKSSLEKKYWEMVKELKMSPTCCIVYLGVDMNLSKYSSIIKSIDDRFHIVINSNADPSTAPKGKSSVAILSRANYFHFNNKTNKQYSLQKKRVIKDLVEKAEKIIPNLSKHIIVQEVATPLTIEKYTSMPEGALYSFDQSIETQRPYFKTPVKGLYLVGSSTFPGAGIEGVTISGIICANAICGWKL